MSFNPGIEIRSLGNPLGFSYGPGTFGPRPQVRSLDAIRASLRDPACHGPDPVYAIAMDVGKVEHAAELKRRMLLFGLVTFAAGQLGREPVRSQGHRHCPSSRSGWRPPEVFEIWSGAACIYMQEFAADNPGRCFAILAGPGDVVIVPPPGPRAPPLSGPPLPLSPRESLWSPAPPSSWHPDKWSASASANKDSNVLRFIGNFRGSELRSKASLRTGPRTSS